MSAIRLIIIVIIIIKGIYFGKQVVKVSLFAVYMKNPIICKKLPEIVSDLSKVAR